MAASKSDYKRWLQSAHDAGDKENAKKLWAQYKTMPDDPQEGQGAAFLEGAGRGGIIAAGGLTGAAGGFQLGGAFGGPWGAAIGTVVGGAGGMYGAAKGADALDLRDPQDMPEHLRASAHVGEALVGSVPFAGAPYIFGKLGSKASFPLLGQKAGPYMEKWVDNILEAAVKNPKRFAAIEAVSASGSALAAGLAEAHYPGETGKRITAEMVGGVLSPFRLLPNFAAWGWSNGKALLRSFSKQAVYHRAAERYQEIVREFGEDPVELAKQLRKAFGAGTSGMLTDSRALKAIEKEIRVSSKSFDADFDIQVGKAFDEIRATIEVLEASGNPQAFKMAAEVRQKYFNTLMETRLLVAEQKAVEAASKIKSVTPAARNTLSRLTEQLIDEALKSARTVERELWEKIPKGTEATADNIFATARVIREDHKLRGVAADQFPPLVEGFLKKWGKTPPKKGNLRSRLAAQGEKGTTVRLAGPDANAVLDSKQLLIFRSRMLGLARDAASSTEQNKSELAKIYGEMAEAALDDLGKLPGAKAARDYSRSLHDTFTRTFAREVLEKSSTGARRTPVELILRKAFMGSDEASALHIDELQDAVKFGGNDKAFDEILDIQEQWLRMAASDTVELTGKNEGKVSVIKAAEFLAKNPLTLNRLEPVRQAIRKSLQGRRDYDEALASGEQALKFKKDHDAFFGIVGEENTIKAVARVLDGNSPEEGLRQLTRGARRSGPDAVNGLRRAILDQAYLHARGNTSDFSFRLWKDRLFLPKPGGKSIMEAMKAEGLITAEGAKQFEEILKRAEKITDSIKSKGVEELETGASVLFDLAVRLAGVNAGGMSVIGKSSGAPIMAAGLGGQFFKKIFERIPEQKVIGVLTEAARNPRLAAALLEEPILKADKINLAKQIHAYLWSAGIIESERAITGE